MVNEIGWKKGDLEIRTTKRLSDGRPYVELVKWNDDNGRQYCFTLAYFKTDNEGNVQLVFVGDRPFRHIEDIDINNVWKELWLTQMMLEGKED